MMLLYNIPLCVGDIKASSCGIYLIEGRKVQGKLRTLLMISVDHASIDNVEGDRLISARRVMIDKLIGRLTLVAINTCNNFCIILSAVT